MQEWHKIKPAAEFSGIKERTMRTWMKKGLRYSRVNGTVLFSVKWLNEFIESHEVTDENKLDQLVNETVKNLS